MKKIKDLRVDYSGNNINLKKFKNNPIEQFKSWFEKAQKSNVIEPNAMVLSTVDKNNIPTSRTVLLKEINKKGFIFFTNYDSRKSKHIKYNKNVSTLFLWKINERQIIINGKCKKISKNESEKYFKSRPRKSKIAAWASMQSSILESPTLLLNKFKDYENKFLNKEIPYPNNWGGYIIKPKSIEFWQGKSSRMHDRILYFKENNLWNKTRLYP